MRITEKNTPILRLLKIKHNIVKPGDDELLEKFKFEEADVLTGEETKEDRSRLSLELFMLGCVWSKRRETYGKEINIASSQFMDAARKNEQKILTPETTGELLKGLVVGTLIFGDTSVSYFILKKQGTVANAFLLVFKKNCLAYLCDSGDGYASRIPGVLPDEIGRDCKKLKRYYINQVLLFLAFRKYADVDMLDAKPFKKVELPDSEDIQDKTLLVDSTLPVKYYDCSWFRTIVRKEGFMVRGHFRMQPYKNEKREWDLKLIYIEPFQKHGYTRTAKKVVEARKQINEES